MLALLTACLRLWGGPRTVDDAYITFRYARNIAYGLGFVYNPGEYILGTTTPLFTLLLALIQRTIGSHLDLAALLINAAADAGTVVIIYAIVHRASGVNGIGIIAGLLFAFSAGSIRFSAGGMESGLFTFFIMLSIWFLIKGSYLFSAGLASLATLTRPEGLILLVVVGGLYIWSLRRVPWRMATLCAVILGPWLVFASIYFGSPFPHSAVAKHSTYTFPALTAFKSLLGYLPGYVLPLTGTIGSRLYKYGFVTSVLLLTAVTVTHGGNKASRSGIVLWLFPALYVSAYTLANPPIWEWYAVPLVPFACCALTIGGAQIVKQLIIGTNFLHLRGSMFPWLRFGISLAATVTIICAGLIQLADALAHDPRVERELVYQTIAQELNTNCAVKGVLVATPEIGALGYFLADAMILDTQGLITPEAISYRKAILDDLKGERHQFYDRWFASGLVPDLLIMARMPEFVVTPDRLGGLLTNNKDFQTTYSLLLQYTSSILGSQSILVYGRKGIACDTFISRFSVYDEPAD